MSEVNDMNERVRVTVHDAEVITVPIDDTLTHSNEAADAAAVGAALALKADASAVVAIDVNGQGADLQGHILIDGTDITMGGTDSRTLKAAVEAADGKTGADIPLSGEVGAPKISAAVSDLNAKNATNIPMSSAESAPMISAKIAAMDVATNANSTAIDTLNAKAGDTILLESAGTQTIAEAVNERVRTVNGDGPDETGNVQVQHALTADNLTSASSQNSVGEWARRTSGGSASIADGDAWLSSVRGNRVHTGYIPEALNMNVAPAPREQGETPITATIDRDVFVAYVETSGIISLVYTTSWNLDPTLYGVTVTGTPVSGDQIIISYTKENRGTIIQSNPQTMVSTGWNLYNNETGYAIALKYAEPATFKITGTYTAVKFSATTTSEKTVIVPIDGLFSIESNGYIWIEGGNDTDTALYMTWSDWVLEGPAWEIYTEDVIDLTEVMTDNFPYGLLRAGDVRDEINFNTGLAISNVQRLAYSAENMAAAEASGRTYEYDENYIYLERATAETAPIEVEGSYTASDHGLEYFTGTDIAVYAIVIYGNNLKNKLERDVLTKSTDLVNDLSTNDGTKALSAAQGYALNNKYIVQDSANVTLSNLTWTSVSGGAYYSPIISAIQGYRPISAVIVGFSRLEPTYGLMPYCSSSDNNVCLYSSVNSFTSSSKVTVRAIFEKT